MCDFKIKRAGRASSIWNHKYDFRPKQHDTKFNYHFITPILKSQSFIVNINILFLLLHIFHFDGLKKGCHLEQKMVQFGHKSHC